MCTYVIEQAKIEGSGRGQRGWFKLNGVRVYYDHPFHSQAEHTLNIDFVNEDAWTRCPDTRRALRRVCP